MVAGESKQAGQSKHKTFLEPRKPVCRSRQPASQSRIVAVWVATNSFTFSSLQGSSLLAMSALADVQTDVQSTSSGLAALLREDDSLLRQMFFGVLRHHHPSLVRAPRVLSADHHQVLALAFAVPRIAACT
jgi:hypothetical protein